MLKSCKYCGRYHQSKFDCGKKPIYKKYKDNDVFRSSIEWRNKRDEIRSRDYNLCQICIRRLYNTINQYTYDDISVHHAIPIEQDYSKRLDNSNLITTCGYHHEMMESGKIPLAEVLEIINKQNIT